MCHNELMNKRSYQQYCPIAYGLDVIGDRWTLLVIRELSLGPRRFSDLQRGLPAMGTNLLASRLKSLQENGVIETIDLPPPARISAYQLSDAGRALDKVLQPLALWGLQFTPQKIPKDAFLGAVPAIKSLRLLYSPEAVNKLLKSVEIHLPPDVYCAKLSQKTIDIKQGYASNAELSFETSPKILYQLAVDALKVDEVIAQKKLLVKQGSPDLVHHFFVYFAFSFE